MVSKWKAWLLGRMGTVSGEVNSGSYWERRYSVGGNSGGGSYSRLAVFKADVLNRLVVEYGIHSVIEFGCGDGAQLSMVEYPNYVGVDVALSAIAICSSRFSGDPTKRFLSLDDYGGEVGELVLSLDVIYHLVEDDVYFRHLDSLFSASTRLVAIYSSNKESFWWDRLGFSHVRHRRFLDDVVRRYPNWQLIRVIPNRYPARFGLRSLHSSTADFFLFKKIDGHR